MAVADGMIRVNVDVPKILIDRVDLEGEREERSRAAQVRWILWQWEESLPPLPKEAVPAEVR